MEEKITKLIVGLGNPGSKYQKTRHNIGFELLDDLAFAYGVTLKNENKFDSHLTYFEKTFTYKLRKKIKEKHVEMIPNPLSKEEHDLAQEKKNPEHRKEYQERIEKIIFEKKTITEDKTKDLKIFLAQPQTFMNNSGKAIAKIMKFYKIENPDLLIIHDDVSLDTGKLRFAFDSGAGGQHGVEDTIECLGGAKNFHRLKFGVGPDPGGERRADYVLSPFPKKETQLLEDTKKEAMHMVKAWLLNEDYQQLV
jgi:PTH1 family peptidyl-tRNA hydrolase